MHACTRFILKQGEQDREQNKKDKKSSWKKRAPAAKHHVLSSRGMCTHSQGMHHQLVKHAHTPSIAQTQTHEQRRLWGRRNKVTQWAQMESRRNQRAAAHLCARNRQPVPELSPSLSALPGPPSSSETAPCKDSHTTLNMSDLGHALRCWLVLPHPQAHSEHSISTWNAFDLHCRTQCHFGRCIRSGTGEQRQKQGQDKEHSTLHHSTNVNMKPQPHWLIP